MKKVLGLFLLISVNTYGQKPNFPFNFAKPDVTVELILSQTQETPFSGYKEEKRQLLASDTSNLWKSLSIWHFEDDASIDALFSFDEHDKLKSIKFSSSNLAEISIEGRGTTDEDYFEMYGKPLLIYFEKQGWKLKNDTKIFPLLLIREDQTLTIKIDTLVDVAITPEADGFSGFHYNFPEDRLPSVNKYLRFEITFKD